jgi:hypothetical protein
VTAQRSHAGLRGARRLARLVTLAALAVGLLGADAHAAAPLAISTTRSDTKPYYACPPGKGRRLRCGAIVQKIPSAGQQRKLGVTPFTGGSGVAGGFSPADLQSAYRLPTANGSGQTVAVVMFGHHPRAESDLATYRTQYGLGACTSASGCFIQVNEAGRAGPYPPASFEAASEIALDLEMVSAACPRCHILLVEAEETPVTNLFQAIRTASSLGATVISNSWGFTAGELREEREFDDDLTFPGLPITFATGDTAGRTGFPAASPHVIAVGGTVLRRAENTRRWTEEAWSGTTAACSAIEPKPIWQTDAGCAGRTYADVSAVAELVSIYLTYEFPGWGYGGGTSAAAPLIAGTLALAEAGTRIRGAAAFYDDTDSTFDVTTGRAGECRTYICLAGTGYDAPTGIGTPNGAPQAIAPAVPQNSSIWALREGVADVQYVFAPGTSVSVTSWAPWSLWTTTRLGGEVASGSVPAVVRDAVSGVITAFYIDRRTNLVAFWSWEARSGWVNAVLGGGRAVAAGTSPTVVRDTATGTTWVYYVESTSRTIAYWVWELRSGWTSGVLGGRAMERSSPTVVRDPVSGAQFLYYVDDSTRRVSFWSWEARSGWANGVFGGTRPAVAGTSPSVARDASAGQTFVAYVEASGIAYWSWEARSGWVNRLIGGRVAANTSPTVVRNEVGGSFVYYVDSRERALNSWAGAGETWAGALLGGRIASGTSPVAIRDSSTGATWTYYVDEATGHLAYFTWSLWGGWDNVVL